MLAHLTDWITNLYAVTGLFGIVLAMAIESCCIPLPSEVVMPLAGVMIFQKTILKGTNPLLAIFLVALSGAIGCLIGSIVAYGIGYKGGRPLVLKYGRYVLISQHDADKADAFFQRWGSATAFFSRFLPVVRTYISLPAGITKMPFIRFCIYSFLGSLPWCFVLAYAGYLLGNQASKLGSIFHGLDVVILVVLVLLVAFYIWHHVRNDRRARVAHAEAEANAQQVSSQIGSQFSQSQWRTGASSTARDTPPQQSYQPQSPRPPVGR